MLTTEERAKLIGGPLANATDRMIASIGTEAFPAALGDFVAEALGRVTTLAAGAILTFDDRLTSVEGRVSALEARQRANSDKISELHLRLDGRAGQLNGLLDRELDPAERARLINLLLGLDKRVEKLEARQVGGSDGRAE